MDILIVRHGESLGNAEGRIQGHADSPLTEKGRRQAAQLGRWLALQGLKWHAAYASPLARAKDTAAIIAATTGFADATIDDDLKEVGVGHLEGLTRTQIGGKHPDFLRRDITSLGDFGEFGGETYDGVQERVARVRARLEQAHRATEDRVLLVAHGGFNFQFVKAAACIPVPRVCLLHWGNCTATLLRFRERRGSYFADVAWHVPTELMGGESGEGSNRVFR